MHIHAKAMSAVSLSFVLASLAACTGSITGESTRPGQPPGSQPPGSQPPGSQPPGSQPPGSQPPGSQPPGSQPGTPVTPTLAAEVPGRTPLRRLTKVQYNNMIRDLFGLTDDAAAGFSSDERVAGFESNTTAPLKELQVEQYTSAAEDLANKASANLMKLAGCAPPATPEATCVDQFLRTFGKRAYRRPLTAEETTRYKALFTTGKGTTGDFAEGISLLVTAMLQSPNFLYVPEVGNAAAAEKDGIPLTPYEVATRISLFAINSMPDDVLLTAADMNQLGTPEQVGAQVRRLLMSPKGRDTIVSFYEQWLDVQDLPMIEKSATVYRTFNADLRSAMRDEVLEFADRVTRQMDGKVETLLTAGFSFVRGGLHALYGLPMPGPANASSLNMVTLPAGQRSGLFTTAGVLAKYGHNDQSSPVARGVLVLEKLLCITPPEPPDDVNTEIPPVNSNQTTRQRLDQLLSMTNDTRCKACHSLMNPLGFTFENYDGIGAWRTMDGRFPVDATATIVGTGAATDGAVKDAVELLRKLSTADLVRECVTKNWFRYALGRGETAEDAGTLGAALSSFTKGGNRVPELIAGIASTRGFRYRKPVQQ
jgi:hypothetical protein